MRWRFALTPKWIIRHVLVTALVVTMIALGFWQLRRHDEKRTYKHLVEARQEQPAVDVTTLLPVDAAVDAVLYRTVRATGTYADADTVVVENRSLNGASGGWVLTPLLLDDGSAVIVNRGFIGFDRDGAIEAPPAPTGTVQVEGLVFPTQRKGRFGATDTCAGEVLVRVDLDCYATRVDVDLLPAWVQLVTSDPPDAGSRGRRPPADRARPARARRRPPPALRRAVVHLHDDRSGRLRAAAAQGRPRAGRRARVTEVAPSIVDGETRDFLLSQPMAPVTAIDQPVSLTDPMETRVVDAMLECISRWGLTKTTADDVARTAGISRATLYRTFPGGMDVVFDAVIRHETARFFQTITPRLDAAEALDDLLVIGYVEAAAFLHGHQALGYVLLHEPERVLPADSVDRLSSALAVATAFAAPHLARFEAAAHAEWVVRNFFSYALNPSPALPLTDEAAVRRLVTTYLTPALMADTPKER